MSRIISFYNQKGGVGKTTSVVNIAAALSMTGIFKKKVLLIDIDPQGNATSGLGLDKNQLGRNIYDLLLGECEIRETIKEVNKNLYLIGSTADLTGFEIEALQMERPNYRLKDALSNLDEEYDYIFIDCPPSLGLLSLNALAASDSVIIPIQAEYYALEGVGQLVKTLDLIRASVNPKLEVEGILLTMYDARTNLAQDVKNEVNKYFSDRVFKTEIPRNIRLAEAPSFGESAISYDKYSKGAQAYIKVAKEIRKRY